MAVQNNFRQPNFPLILMLKISILGASICIGRKSTYFIRASESGEINKGKSSIIEEKDIKIGRQGSIISSTTKVEGG